MRFRRRRPPIVELLSAWADGPPPELPDEPPDDGRTIRWSAGALDGVVSRHGDATAEIEIRASWSPVPGSGDGGTVDVTRHAEAWGEVLCTAAGLPPVPPGVVAMPTRRGQRGR